MSAVRRFQGESGRRADSPFWSQMTPKRTSALEKREEARSEPPQPTWSAVPVKAIIKILIVQNRFHPNQTPPTRFENKFVFNWQVRAGRYFYGYHLPMQCRTSEGSAICRTA